MLGAVGLVGCAPTRSDAGATSEQTAPAPTPERSAEQRELDAWIARYQRGEVSKASPDPTVRYSGTPELPCKATPAERPKDFRLKLSHVDYERGLTHFTGISADVCVFEWGPLHLDPPPGRCTVLAAAELDELYASIRADEAWTIESQRMEETPHHVGVNLVMRWPGARCEIQDVHGWAVVAKADEARWRRVLDAVRQRM